MPKTALSAARPRRSISMKTSRRLWPVTPSPCTTRMNGGQDLEALAVDLVTEGVHEPLGGVGGDLDDVAGVGARTHETGEVLDQFLQLATEDVLDAVLVVVGVGQDEREAVVAVGLEHVADRVDLVVAPPGGEAGVLGVGAGVRRRNGVVPPLGGEDARGGVALVEVDQVRHAAERGGLLRADAAGAVVVEHVTKDSLVVGRPLQGGADHLLAQPAQSADRGRVPDGPQQSGLEEAGHPVVLRVGVDELQRGRCCSAARCPRGPPRSRRADSRRGR